MQKTTKKYSFNMKKIIGVSLILGLQAFGMGATEFIHTSVYGKAEAAIDARTFGAKGNGVTDSTAAIQAAINSLGATGGTVVVPPGTYMVNALQSIKLPSKVTLQMAPTTILKVIPNSATRYSVISITDASYAAVRSGVLLGDRYTHLGTTGEWGHGINIKGGNNISIVGTASNQMWGDGFYIGAGANGAPPKNVRLVDVTADNNRRQGISLISGTNVSIIRPILTNTMGTPPAAGLDIEPNTITDTLQNISIIDPYTANNQGAGIGINLVKLAGTTVPVSIKITNHVDDGSQRGFSSVNGTAIVPGSLVIDNPIWKNNKLNGFAVTNQDYRSFSITVNNPQVIDANSTGPMNASTGAAFAMYSYKPEITLGNIHINNAVITDTRSAAKTVTGFYVADTSGKAVVNLSIVNPIINGTILQTLKAASSTTLKLQ